MSQTDQSLEPNSNSNGWRSRFGNLETPENKRAVVVAIVFTLMIVVLFGYSIETRLILLIIVPLAITSVYYMLPQITRLALREWSAEYGMTITSWMASWLLITAVILWLTVSFWWQPLYEDRKTVELLDKSGMYVTASYPIGIPADGCPVDLNFTISNSQGVTETILLDIYVPASSSAIRLVNSPLPLELVPGSQLSQTISLVNTQSLRRVRTTQYISLSVDMDFHKATPKTVGMTVEGTVGARLRRFVNSTVDKASPLIIIIAFLIPLLFQVTQQFIEKKEKEKKQQEKDRQEEEKGKAEQLQEKHKQEASQSVRQLRRFIINKQFKEAKNIIKQLQQPHQQELEPEAIKIGQQLMELVDLTCQPQNVVNIIQESRVWPNESASVFWTVWQQNSKTHNQAEAEQQGGEGDGDKENRKSDLLNALEKARFRLPVESMDSFWQDKLSIIELEIHRQASGRSIFRPIEGWPIPPRNSILPVATGKIFSPGHDPFVHELAEKDLYFLFGYKNGSFWGGIHYLTTCYFTQMKHP